jgi:tRNA A37 methylthiotransferase MiaB
MIHPLFELIKMSSSNGKTKVGLVQINNSFSGQEYLPLAAGYLQAHAQKYAKNAKDIEFLDPIYKRIKIDDAVERLHDADIVGFSTYVWNFELSKAIAKKLKEKKPSTTILFGGCHVPEPFSFHRQHIPGEYAKLESYISKGGIPDFFNKKMVLGEDASSKEGYEDQVHYNFYTPKDRGLLEMLEENRYIDYVTTGEGEISFTTFLENYPNKQWETVPSFHYRDNTTGELVSTFPAPRIENLNEIPSPYLNGAFERLMQENKEGWIALFETNRGCPYSCKFCDWGTESKNRLSNFDLDERIFKEIDWISENEIGFVYCCDANFGMFTGDKYKFRDLKIVQKFAQNKKRVGHPHRFSVQNTKNATESIYEIQKTLNDSGLDKGVLLAFQSLHKPTLDAIKRSNISINTYFSLQKRFTSEGMATFSDLIFPLQEETYDSFTKGVSTLIEHGQHNRIQFNNHSLLPNTPDMDDIERYKFDIIETDIINIHGSLDEFSEVKERQKLVVGTNTMPRENWRRAYCFGRMANLIHFNKLLQPTNVIVNSQFDVSYKEIIDSFLSTSNGDFPVVSETNEMFQEHARNIQSGGPEYIHSLKWLDIWWPADELAMIELVANGNLDKFYEESEKIFTKLISSKEERNFENLLHQTLQFNRQLIKHPYNKSDKEMNLNYDVWEVYKAGLLGKKERIKQGEFSYIINQFDEASNTNELDYSTDDAKPRNYWFSFEDWAKRVVWWGNKKGDYMYSCKPIEEMAIAP